MNKTVWANSVFDGLPCNDPMSMINLSGTCAMTKLMQCKAFDVHKCAVSSKFEKDPDNLLDISREDFLARKKIVDEVAQWTSSHKGSKSEVVAGNEWIPILYGYEIVKSSSKQNRDWGHLIFTDTTLTRYLLVMCFGKPDCDCGDPSHHNYDAITKSNADRFMSLLKYLRLDESKPSWIRATYTTSVKRTLNPSFLASFDGPKPPTEVDPQVFHVTSWNFVPSLASSEINKMDNLLSQCSFAKQPPVSTRTEVPDRKQVRPQVKAYPLENQNNARQCASCQKVSERAMPTCSRCKLRHSTIPGIIKDSFPLRFKFLHVP